REPKENLMQHVNRRCERQSGSRSRNASIAALKRAGRCSGAKWRQVISRQITMEIETKVNGRHRENEASGLPIQMHAVLRKTFRRERTKTRGFSSLTGPSPDAVGLIRVCTK
ncbi:hypothetical protein, partial [Burkholderia territorii]|uniref:hypothetical protein n=1 Tax=Burkholderia territorii TaxID=1503055 RepID=UPI001BA9C450